MYHDEFLKKPVQPRPFAQESKPGFEIGIGGGISLGFAASLNPTISLVLLHLGGLLPLVICSITIASLRTREALKNLGSILPPRSHHFQPVPHLTSAFRTRARASRVSTGSERPSHR